MSVVLETNLPFPAFRRGKVRDVYDLGQSLLIVATDRVSAFDCVMTDGIPGKGRILTQVANFWFQATQDILPNQLLATKVEDYPAELHPFRELLDGRSILVKKTNPLPIECVVRGYLAGSGLKEYQAKGTVCGISLPAGLRLADPLPEPLFTPSTKAEEGHDENITFERTVEIVGLDLAQRLRDLSIALYKRGCELARERGILLADTKFEFGTLPSGELILIDEALTPDSSRYWLADQWTPGINPPSLDKQFLRDYLETLPDWDKQPPAPSLPAEIIQGIRDRYLDLAGRFNVKL
ncbi:phosphoribosylaminoimidazolesuccinocarboxamide synthase [Holophaga foetida]|uniref:phosphoribosylaminoimidazolesuccinocarboxamide synthase n=1 Tax=Holophaga foetida TaxID=35839 RepID=UPI00024753BB|nr:phosphoribosylaminoimidazolesuccinocarboxamide synthase [Holophaga foetida]